MVKKISSMALALILATSMAVPAFAATPGKGDPSKQEKYKYHCNWCDWHTNNYASLLIHIDFAHF